MNHIATLVIIVSLIVTAASVLLAGAMGMEVIRQRREIRKLQRLLAN